MIDFEKYARISQEGDMTLERILSKKYDNFDQYQEVGKIMDLEVAKVVIKRLLDKFSDTTELLDGVTLCCGYDFGLDEEKANYCPICGKKIIK